MALNITIHSKEGERYAQIIEAGRHIMAADRPKKYGGNDRGPGPYSYLLAALGACAAITLRMYAERKKIPLEDVRIQLSHHRRGPAHSPGGELVLGRIDAIDGSIQLVGDLDTAQRRRLLKIAGRCWMHRTLSAGVDIRFHLRDTSRVGSHRQTILEQKLAV
jgi:putative redox protein